MTVGPVEQSAKLTSTYYCLLLSARTDADVERIVADVKILMNIK